MRIFGAAFSGVPADADAVATLVLLDEPGRVQAARRPGNLPALALEVVQLAAPDPFLLAVDLPVVVPSRPARTRPVESLVRRRLGHRLAPGGRSSKGAGAAGVAAEALIAALAATGHPCLPYPDRDRRTSGLAEIHPALVLKALLWEGAPQARGSANVDRRAIFRAYAAPDYRVSSGRKRASWVEDAVALDLTVRALGSAEGYDLDPVVELLAAASSESDASHAASLLDACLLAGTAKRYLDSPEACVFLGDREGGYTILPADGFVRRLALQESPAEHGSLFPKGSLRKRLGEAADLRALDLLDMPGRPQRLEAVFRAHPVYEFDNLDEMLWWKHCRHVSGPTIPTEGLRELTVTLGPEAAEGERRGAPLRLVRSRHRTLSFRFDPPRAWRAHIATRDGRTYPFEVLRATYDSLPG